MSEFLVSHGKSGGLGCFVSAASEDWPRGSRVVVKTIRGLEVGTVLCPASSRQTRLLGSASAGRLLRGLTADDGPLLDRHDKLGQEMFDFARALATDLGLAIEILDIDLLFDGSQAILQYLGPQDDSFSPLVEELEKRFACEVRLENLSCTPTEHEDHDDHHGGCGKPDCGRTDGGGCSTCSTGGGCSSCGAAKVDMLAYFSHLRTQIEERHERTPLV